MGHTRLKTSNALRYRDMHRAHSIYCRIVIHFLRWDVSALPFTCRCRLVINAGVTALHRESRAWAFFPVREIQVII